MLRPNFNSSTVKLAVPASALKERFLRTCGKYQKRTGALARIQRGW